MTGPRAPANPADAAGVAFCGIDVGTQGVRAEIVNAAGRLLGEGASALTDDHRDGPVHEQSAQSWWHAAVEAVRGAVAQAGDGVEVAAVALDATSGTVLVEGADGEARGRR